MKVKTTKPDGRSWMMITNYDPCEDDRYARYYMSGRRWYSQYRGI